LPAQLLLGQLDLFSFSVGTFSFFTLSFFTFSFFTAGPANASFAARLACLAATSRSFLVFGAAVGLSALTSDSFRPPMDERFEFYPPKRCLEMT
jgi:hypothetical protein